MIDTTSEPGAWQRELEQRPRRCDWCRNYVNSSGMTVCALDRPLVPCKFYEREPGADDDDV